MKNMSLIEIVNIKLWNQKIKLKNRMLNLSIGMKIMKNLFCNKKLK